MEYKYSLTALISMSVTIRDISNTSQNFTQPEFYILWPASEDIISKNWGGRIYFQSEWREMKVYLILKNVSFDKSTLFHFEIVKG